MKQSSDNANNDLKISHFDMAFVRRSTNFALSVGHRVHVFLNYDSI